MKKIFFTTIVAIVAVGGGFAQGYRITPGAGPAEFYCSGLQTPLCSTFGIQIYNTDGTPADEEVYIQRYVPAAF